MAGKKITNDQKRAKKKEAERKRSLQRQHERNRIANQADGLMVSISHAIEGHISIEDLERELVALGTSKSSVLPSTDGRFESGAWIELRQATCRMVELAQFDPLEERGQQALEGRIYTIEGGDDQVPWYQPHFMPLEAVRLSGWELTEAFSKFVAGFEGAPREGCYFLGFPIGPLAVHFAFASTAGLLGKPQVYLVTAKGWHSLQLERWTEVIFPMVLHALMAREVAVGNRSSSLAVERLASSDGDAEFEEVTLTRESREIIRLLGEALVEEVDDLARASLAQAEARSAERFFNGLLGERSDRAEEIDDLRKQVAQLRAELQEAQRSGISPPDAARRPLESAELDVASLSARMSALIFGGAEG